MLTLEGEIAFVSDAIAQCRSPGLCAGEKTNFFSFPPEVGCFLSQPDPYGLGRPGPPESVQRM